MWNYIHLPDNENICYLTYEEMSADLDKTITKVADFLGKTVSVENSEKIKDYLKFENMKSKFNFLIYEINFLSLTFLKHARQTTTDTHINNISKELISM